MSNIVFFVIGFLVSTFTLLQVIIILFFAIPTTKKIEKLSYLKKDNKILRNNFISLIVISAIYLVVLLIVKTFFPNGFVPFIAGIIPMLLFGITKIGKNKDNVTDFIESHKNSFTVHPWEIIKVLLPKETAEHSVKFAQPLVDNLNKNVKADIVADFYNSLSEEDRKSLADGMFPMKLKERTDKENIVIAELSEYAKDNFK